MSDLYDRIRKRAYALWEQEGRPEGRSDDFWYRAEAEVGGVHSCDEAPPGTPGAGEHVCPTCEGTGRTGGKPCKACGGTGRTVQDPQP